MPKKGKIMLTIKEIQDGLEGLSLTQVSRDTGVNRQTLWEIRSGRRDNIQYKTMQRLSEYFGA